MSYHFIDDVLNGHNGKRDYSANPARPNCWKLFGVRKECTEEEVQSQYKKLMLYFHPDRKDAHIEASCRSFIGCSIVQPHETNSDDALAAIETCKTEVGSWVAGEFMYSFNNPMQWSKGNWQSLVEAMPASCLGFLLDTKGAHDNYLLHWFANMGVYKDIDRVCPLWIESTRECKQGS